MDPHAQATDMAAETYSSEPPVVITAHAWERYEQRVRAHLRPEAFRRTVREALRRGHEIAIQCSEGAFCRMYRRFAFLFEDHGSEIRLITVLPRGVRPNSEIRADD